MSLSLLFPSHLSCLCSFFVSSNCATMAFAAAATQTPRLQMKSMGRRLKSCKRFCDVSKKRRELIVRVSSNSEVVNSDDPQFESDDGEYLSLDQQQLDSKLQLKLEQKLRMKFSKKIRMRRKKLVHKRRMRKRGQWPPSKMKKLKNV